VWDGGEASKVTFIAWWMEVVVQCTGSGGGVEESPVGHKVGNNVAMVRSLCELEWGKREKEGSGLSLEFISLSYQPWYSVFLSQ
jgi:hypothetical protein